MYGPARRFSKLNRSVSKQGIISFAESLPDRCKNERDMILRNGEGKWDTRIRKSFAEVLSFWFCEAFELSPAESKGYLYVEGWNPIPDNMRGLPFFGTKMHPDAALIFSKELAIAVELDHGTKGSQIRNALAKASFSVILGGYKRAMVLFFIDGEKRELNLGLQRGERTVLQLYRTTFRTSLHLV